MKILIFGATGMVGSEVLKELLKSEQITEIVSVGRKTSGIKRDNFKEIIHDNFLDFSNLSETFSDTDIVYYCLGVYQGKVSKQEFWRITVGFQDALIRELEKVKKDIVFCLFSAQGADQNEKSPILFAKAKGRAEKHLLDSKIAKKYIFRPGYINPDNGFPHPYVFGGLFRLAYMLLPLIGINASALGKVIARVGLNGYNKGTLTNKDIRQLAYRIAK